MDINSLVVELENAPDIPYEDLKLIREMYGLSQDEMGVLLGMTQSSYGQLERNRRNAVYIPREKSLLLHLVQTCLESGKCLKILEPH